MKPGVIKFVLRQKAVIFPSVFTVLNAVSANRMRCQQLREGQALCRGAPVTFLPSPFLACQPSSCLGSPTLPGKLGQAFPKAFSPSSSLSSNWKLPASTWRGFISSGFFLITWPFRPDDHHLAVGHCPPDPAILPRLRELRSLTVSFSLLRATGGPSGSSVLTCYRRQGLSPLATRWSPWGAFQKPH